MKPNILYLHCHDAGRYVQPYGHAVRTPHIQALARISRLMTDQNFRDALDNAETAEEMYELIATCEANAQE